MKVAVDVPGSPSQIVPTVSVDVKQHWRRRKTLRQAGSVAAMPGFSISSSRSSSTMLAPDAGFSDYEEEEEKTIDVLQQENRFLSGT